MLGFAKQKQYVFLLGAALLLSHGARAEDVDLMTGVVPRSGAEGMIPADQFKKVSPWKIGMSHFGVNANTWAAQMAAESQAAAKSDPRISQFVLLDANLSQAKQIADIDELIAQKVDAIIITPVSPTSADAGIEKAVNAGIPVIVHTGLTKTDKYTVDIQGGGENFGKVSGEFLVKELGGKGNIWVLRGLPTHPEDINRYKGLLEAIKGTDIKIVAEDAGLWSYDYGHKVCETFYLENPKVDGIWSSGADMSRACMDVFQQYGAKVPPITGEVNNGFLQKWIESGVDAVATEYGPEQGAAAVRAAVALLEGKAIHKRYVYEPDGWDIQKAKANYRADLSEKFWMPSSLSDSDLKALYGKP
ncbi:substrate-binding domain-containing protein [Agrobacterium sp. MAFF310724]|uniref:substrate-binding domain-containing protein n=1 Tax=Agrobacterium TaxID=357 RepID=UPI001F2C4B8D|nr:MULTISPECIES: substrate-binding domain-containing protein [Agrobacterium]MCZ7976323.1 substrate-binding domain-containing protein [Agrobacterium salinitolerans]MDA5243211.1 substrate-binding domain-containing protein [Agrobacterium sp. MAFF310724]MDA5247607.1 substrate-binding domain-containing protein [Agrobacterium sp. MAFF210268]